MKKGPPNPEWEGRKREPRCPLQAAESGMREREGQKKGRRPARFHGTARFQADWLASAA